MWSGLGKRHAEEFVCDICEIEALIEPALTCWFVDIVTKADVEELARSQLEMRFHRLMYDKHHTAMPSISGYAIARSCGQSADAFRRLSAGNRMCSKNIAS
jgi:hypothetical protein